MLKLFQFWARRQDLTQKRAIAHLRDDYAPALCRRAPPSIARYVSNVGLAADYSGWSPAEAPAYDAVTEFWLSVDSTAELERVARQSRLVRNAGEREFIGSARLMAAEQVVFVDHGRQHAGVKTIFLLTRRPEMTHSEAISYWLERHAPLVRDTLGDALVRYATNIGLASSLQGWPQESSPYDGVAELWLDLPMAEMRAAVGAAAGTLLPDERAFLGTYTWLAVDEVVHLGDPAQPLPTSTRNGVPHRG